MNFSQLMETLLVLFAILFLGYVAGKCKIIDQRGQKTISAYIAKIASPLLIFSSVTSENLSGDKSQIIVVFFVGVGLYIIMPMVSRLLSVVFHVEARDRVIYEMMLVFSNAAFLAFPVLRAMYGDQAVFYAAIINISFNICIYSYGVYRFMKAGDIGQSQISIRRIINPGVIAATLAMIIYFFDIPIPNIVATFSSMVGETTISLSMFVIGVALSFVRIGEIFSESKIYLFCLLRLIILPIVSFYIMKLITDDLLLIGVVTVIQTMPAATLTNVFSTQYGGNSQLAAKGVFVSTLCSIITIPLIAGLLLI